MHIQTEPDRTAAAIRDYMAGRDELLDADQHLLDHPLAGHCYVASEAYYHLYDGQEYWVPQHVEVTWDGGRVPHWFLKSRSDDRIVDLTARQFSLNGIDIEYGNATGRGFVPPSPSGRCIEVMENIKNE